MDKRDMRKTLQQLRILTKYGMTGMLLLLTIHCGLLFFNYDIFLIHIIFWIFVLIIGYKLSCIYKMCLVHKCSVLYSMSVIFCIALKSHSNVMTDNVHIIRGAMCILGIFLVILNIIKLTDNTCENE